jgi:hypothetical protein
MASRRIFRWGELAMAGLLGVLAYMVQVATNLRETNIEALQAVAEIIKSQKC